MRPRIVLTFLLSCLMLAALGQRPREVTVMSYNVRHCSGMDLLIDYDRTAKVMTQQQPDVIALQELDSVTGRSGQRDQLAELAGRTHYHPVYGSAIDFDGGQYGVGILTREMPLSTQRIPLPGEEPRVLLVVELQDYAIACTHLDLEEEQRLASLPIIVEEASRWQKPFLLAGDWNDGPDSELLQAMKVFFVLHSGNEPTYPADKPTECIDYVASFISRPAETLRSRVIDEPEASDHRPLLVSVVLQ